MTSLPEFDYKELDHRQIDSSLKNFGLVKIALNPSHANAMLAWIRKAEAIRYPRRMRRLPLLLAVAGFFVTLIRVFVFHTNLLQAGALVMPFPVTHSLHKAPDGSCVFQFKASQHEV
jgi:hypothetical protein